MTEFDPIKTKMQYLHHHQFSSNTAQAMQMFQVVEDYQKELETGNTSTYSSHNAAVLALLYQVHHREEDWQKRRLWMFVRALRTHPSFKHLDEVDAWSLVSDILEQATELDPFTDIDSLNWEAAEDAFQVAWVKVPWGINQGVITELLEKADLDHTLSKVFEPTRDQMSTRCRFINLLHQLQLHAVSHGERTFPLSQEAVATALGVKQQRVSTLVRLMMQRGILERDAEGYRGSYNKKGRAAEYFVPETLSRFTSMG